MTPARGLKMSYSIVLHKNLLGEEIGDETIKIYIYNSLCRLAIVVEVFFTKELDTITGLLIVE